MFRVLPISRPAPLFALTALAGVALPSFGQEPDPVVTNNPSEIEFEPAPTQPPPPIVMVSLPPQYWLPGGKNRMAMAQVQGEISGKICLPVSSPDGTPITYACGAEMSREVGATVTVGGTITLPGGAGSAVYEKAIAVNEKITFGASGECQECAGYICFENAKLQVVKLTNRHMEITVVTPVPGGFTYTKATAEPRCWDNRELCCDLGHEVCCDEEPEPSDPDESETPPGGGGDGEEDGGTGDEPVSSVFRTLTIDLRSLTYVDTGLAANWLSEVEPEVLAGIVHAQESIAGHRFEFAYVLNADGTAVEFDLSEPDPFGVIMPHDVDKNGVVDDQDIAAVLELEGTSANFSLLDFDDDGWITSLDAELIVPSLGQTWNLSMPSLVIPYSHDAVDTDWYGTEEWDEPGTAMGFGEWIDYAAMSVQFGTTVVLPYLCVDVNSSLGVPLEYKCNTKYERSVGETVTLGGSVTVPLGPSGADIGASFSTSHSVTTAISHDAGCRKCVMNACFRNARVEIDKVQSQRRKAIVLKFAPPMASAYTSIIFAPKCEDARQECCDAGIQECCDSEEEESDPDEESTPDEPGAGNDEEALYVDLRQYVDIETGLPLLWSTSLDTEDHELLDDLALTLSGELLLTQVHLFNADGTWIEIDLMQNDPFNQDCKEDIDGDGQVTDADASRVSDEIGRTADQSICDVDGDGEVTETDLDLVTAAVGTGCSG